MTTHRIPRRTVICQKCGHVSISALKNRDICRSCYQREPSVICRRCQRPFHQGTEPLQICPICAPIVSRSIGKCSRCTKHSSLVNRELLLCKHCHDLHLRHIRELRRRALPIQCVSCHQLRVPAVAARLICRRCLRLEKTLVSRCNGCHRIKPLCVKDRGLCRRCYGNSSASRLLKSYIRTYDTPYPDNLRLFQILSRTIQWDGVNEEKLRAVIACGQHLKITRLSFLDTWEKIESVLPKLGSTGRKRTLMIRQGLRAIGYYLAKTGKLESYDAYLAGRCHERLLTSASGSSLPLLRFYQQHLRETKHRSAGIRRQLEILTSFTRWCERTCIRFPHEIQPTQIKTYLLSLYDHWTCTKCEWTVPAQMDARLRAYACPLCGTNNLTVKPGRSYQTVRAYHSCLKMFFLWAKLTRRVMNNPVEGKMKAPKQTLKTYDRDVLFKLLKYVRDPHSNPCRALTLYLILCHLFTVWELRHARIPAKLQATNSFAEAYRISVQHPDVSRSNHAPGRPNRWVHFAPSATVWLTPLLHRFEQMRREECRDPANDYLLLAPTRSRYGLPVSASFVWELVGQASQEALGKICTPKILRASAALFFVDRHDAGVLQAMGWKNQQAHVYSYAPRISITPRSKLNTT